MRGVRSDKTNTKKLVLAYTAAVFLAATSLAFAQQANQKPLAEVAKQEEARRNAVKKPAKVYTNGSLRQDLSAAVPAPPSTAPAAAAAGNASASNATPAAPATAAAPAAPPAGQAEWAARMKTARETLARTQIFADSLQSRINSLQTDFVNRDDPAQKAQIKTNLDTALAELERVKKELEEQTKAISTIEDEARRAGVPAGWLRPGA
jgi:hypothetical protein